MIDSFPMVLAKGLIAAAATLLFLTPLATPAGLIAGVAGTLAGYLAARRARDLRIAAGLVIATLALVAGQLLAGWLRAAAPAGGTQTTLALADVAGFGLGGFGVFFAVRLLSERVRVFSVLELGVVVAAVAHTFADHRHQRIHQPRFLSDWAWAHGIDPEAVLAAAGVAALVLAALMLLRTRRAAKLLLTLLLLLLGAGFAFWIFGDARIEAPADTNDLGLTKNEKESSSGSSSQKPPDPVAVALLHDDLPDAEVLYFRQNVLSRLAVDRLVADTSGRFDEDVIGGFPVGGAPLDVKSPEDPGTHRRLRTSMFLLADHAQPIGLAQPFEMRALENPNPRRFVAAYDVESWFPTWPIGRLVGRTAMPPSWTDEEKRHYTEIPADPRYKELADKLVRDVDPRFVGDDVMTALAIKRYLEKNGFYSLKEKKLVGNDPTARFLFGEMRGYCVHFAHAAAMLLRSEGIPARVAVGYGVQTSRRGAGSSVLIFGHEAHAWPEIYLDGVGWVTFDIYPERSDEPPPPQIDQDLESTLGELARKDKTGGHAADPSAGLHVPWAAIGGVLGGLGAAALLAAYAVKLARRLPSTSPRRVYRAVLDRLSDLGEPRQFGETRERHAKRLATLAPSFAPLTRAHLGQALGHGGRQEEIQDLARRTRAELRHNTKLARRALALLNPIGWWYTR